MTLSTITTVVIIRISKNTLHKGALPKRVRYVIEQLGKLLCLTRLIAYQVQRRQIKIVYNQLFFILVQNDKCGFNAIFLLS